MSIRLLKSCIRGGGGTIFLPAKIQKQFPRKIVYQFARSRSLSVSITLLECECEERKFALKLVLHLMQIQFT